MATPTNSKNDIVTIRIKPVQRDLIDKAAEVLHKNRSEFILDSVCKEAENVLLDRRLFIVNEEQYQAFIKMLDTSIQDNDRIKTLLNSSSPWEK